MPGLCHSENLESRTGRDFLHTAQTSNMFPVKFNYDRCLTKVTQPDAHSVALGGCQTTTSQHRTTSCLQLDLFLQHHACNWTRHAGAQVGVQAVSESLAVCCSKSQAFRECNAELTCTSLCQEPQTPGSHRSSLSSRIKRCSKRGLTYFAHMQYRCRTHSYQTYLC